MVGRRFATTSLVVVGTSVVALALAIAVIGGPRSGSTAASLAPPASVVGVGLPSPFVGVSPAPTATASSSSVEQAPPSATPAADSATPSPIPVPTIGFEFDPRLPGPIPRGVVPRRFPDPGRPRHSLDEGLPMDRDHPPRRIGHHARRVRRRTPIGSCRTSTRDVTEIDGHRTLRRAGCGFVDGDVMIGRDVYSFSLEGAGPYEPVLLFGRIAATIQLPEPFASTINDFTLSIPPGWEALAATEPDAPDRFYGPGNLNFDVTTDRKTGDPRAVSWAESHFHRRTTLHGDQQFCANGTLAPPARERKFEPSTIEGHPAAVRYSCGYVDAVFAPDRSPCGAAPTRARGMAPVPGS